MSERETIEVPRREFEALLQWARDLYAMPNVNKGHLAILFQRAKDLSDEMKRMKA